MSPAEIERLKDLLPTSLGSAEIREQIAADILRRSVFSARMASAHYLAKIREVCAAILDGTINQADARAQLLSLLGQMGHSPQDGGGITNPASIRRLNLILDTQTQMASSVARLAGQTSGTLALWPAWELTRLETRAVPRADWAARWNLAGQSVGWQGALPTHVGGRMVALKNSPIWAALGNGVGGFRDTLGNPYPPFAYCSGLDWVEVDAEECARMGLVVGDSGSGSGSGSGSWETPTLSPGEKDIQEAIRRYGIPDIGKGILE